VAFLVCENYLGVVFMKQLKKLVQVMIVCGGLVALSGCSYLHHKNGAAGSDSDGSTVQASGAGEGDGYSDGDDNSSGSGKSLLASRTYYFDFDKNEVHESDKPAILANADYLIAHPNVQIVLAGHTDPRGSREYNVALGERRAKSVLDILKSRGVSSGQVRVVSYGQEKLASPGRTEQDYQLDRRAQIVLAAN